MNTVVDFAQRGLYIQSKFSKEMDVKLNFVVEVSLVEGIDLERLKNAFAEIYVNESLLRSFVKEDEGIPYWYIEDTKDIDIREITIFTDGDLDRIRKEELNWEFDINQYPLYKISLVKYKEQNVIFLNFHHILMDTYSVYLLLQKVEAAYKREEIIESLDYFTYSKVNEQLYQAGGYNKIFDYWRNQIGEEPSYIELSLSEDKKSGDGHRKKIILEENEYSELEKLCHTQRATVTDGITTVFYLMIYSLVQEPSLAFGYANSGRNNHNLLKSIGNYANMQILNIDIDEEDSFVDVLKKLRKNQTMLFLNGSVPFHVIREKNGMDVSYSQLPYKIFINQIGANGITYELFNNIEVHTHLAHELTFLTEDTGKRIIPYIYYDKALYNDDEIEDFISLYKEILCEIISSPNEKIMHLDSCKE